MAENTDIQLFEEQKIRTAWVEEQEEWYFSVQDVVVALSGSTDPKQYTINEQICEKAESYPIPKAGIGAPVLPHA